MKTFLVLAFTDPEAKPSEHEGSGDMGAWEKWMKDNGDAVVDMGAPLAGGVEGSGKDGFAEIKPDMWPAQGYMMIQAEDIEAAQEIMKGSPLGADMPLRIFEKVPMQ